MKKTVLIAGLCLLFAGGAAIAAGTTVVSSPIADGSRIRSTIEVLDNTTLRIHVGTAPDYLLVLQDKLYSVNGKHSTDVTQLRAQIRMPAIGDENIRLISKLEDAGRTETIAGLSGEVFKLRYYDKNMQFIEEEMVVSDDSRVRELTLAWKAYFDLGEHAGLRGREVLHDYLSARGLGVLRMGTQFQVEGFGVTPALDRFSLPVSP